jgi:hypothetical protein
MSKEIRPEFRKRYSTFSNGTSVLLKRACMTLRIVEHPFALYLLNFMAEEKTVTQVMLACREPQSIVSGWLLKLRLAKVVTTRRAGKFIYYQTKPDVLDRLIDSCKTILG